MCQRWIDLGSEPPIGPSLESVFGSFIQTLNRAGVGILRLLVLVDLAVALRVTESSVGPFGGRQRLD